MDPEEALELAQQAIEKVSHIAVYVGQKNQRSVCGRLGGELFIVADYLQGIQIDEVDQLSKVPKLLRDIESICSWPSRSKDDYYPCLRGIARSMRGTSSYKQAEATIIRGLTKITSGDGEAAENAILHIRRFTKRGGIKKKKVEEINDIPKSMPVDYLDDAKDQEGDVSLDMLFSLDPSRERMPCRWQDVRFRVPLSEKREMRRQKRARFVDSNESALSKLSVGCSEEVDDGGFCRLIRHWNNHARMCMTVYDGKLHRLLDSEPLQQIVDHTPGISLADVIQNYHLTPKIKATLGYILAQSVWQFYDSDWLKAPWTSQTIQFMKHYDSPLRQNEPGIFTSKPYYSVYFGDDNAGASEATANAGEIHRYPRVRDLGIMLVEIGLGHSVDNSVSKHDDTSRISKANNDWLLAKGYSDLKTAWLDFDYPKYRVAVENCLDPDIFARAPFTPSVKVDELAKSLNKRRKIFYERVVSPLEELVQGTGWKDMVHSMPSLRLQTTTKQEPVALEHVQPPVESKKSTKDQKDAKRWLKRTQLLNHELKSLSQGPTRRVRIAILDTGYDADAIFFQPTMRRNRLVKWKDWVENAKSPSDCNGHGTHLVSLIMMMAPEADICVARVAKDPRDLENASEAIAQAIEWAQSECDVNIVSMSFGFTATQPSISKAIRKAVNDRDDSIIFFAAAANSGLNESEMFPARHECVISVRGTNSNGAFQDFNPPRSSRERTVIGTLGLDVPASGLSHDDGDVYSKGTSVATAIAAGIAGILLGYVENNAGRTPWTYSGLDDDLRWARLEALV
ncbi:peptidase s8 subtilisin kexin sedolisin [Fusarium longipes]|uniref:Peptidase s8 subtilisin kexin sedolisin n=1 Tax=Fusarium longipes TaxID=694270 RepID=A0A395T289_9HYPO|nr:peptidase s8 subtilisin kexin sedolisin [Fusarium longipes]